MSDRATHARRRGRSRRFPAWETVLGWTTFVVFVLIAVGPALLPGKTLFATDLLTNTAPWRSVVESGSLREVALNPWMGDTVDAVNPQVLLVAEGLRSGTLYQWDPYIAGGTILGGTPNSAAFSPISLPWLLFPGPYAPVAVKLLELTAIAVGMALLLRRWGLAPAVAPVAATIYASSGFLVAWTNWPQTRVAALVPLLFWAVDRAVVQRRARDALAVALVLASMLLGGFPAVTAYALCAVAVYAVLRAVLLPPGRRAVLRSAITSVAGLAAGAGLAAWQLVPFLWQSMTVIDFDVRQQNTEEHLHFSSLATALVPDLLGRVNSLDWSGNVNPVETLSYVGVGAVVLAVVALLVRSRRRSGAPRGMVTYAAIGTVVCVLLIFVGGAPLALVQKLPVFDSNYIGRLRVMFGFFVALLAAAGLSALLSRGSDRAPAAEPVAEPLAGAALPGTGAAAASAVVDAAEPQTQAAEPQTQAAEPQTQAAEPQTAVAEGPDAVVAAPTARRPWERVRDVVVLLLVVGTVVGAVVAAASRVVDTDAAQDLARTSLIWAGVLLVLVLAAVAVLVLARGRWFRLTALATVLVAIAAPAGLLAREWWPVTSADDFYPDSAVHDFLAEHLGEDRFLSYQGAMTPGSSSVYGLRAANGHGFHTQEWKDMLLAVDPDIMVTATYSTLMSLTEETLTSPVLDQLSVKYVVASPGSPVVGTREDTQGDGSTVVGSQVIGEVSGTVRAVMIDVNETVADATLRLDLVAADGTVLVSAERSSAVARISFTFPDVEVDGTAEVRLTIEGGGSGAEIALRSDDAGAVALTLMRPSDDGIHLVFTDGADVYERDTVLERVRWASSAVLEDDPGQRIALLASGELDADTVVLQDADLPITQGSGTADVDLVQDDPGAITVQVDAEEDGWLVIGDSWAGGGWWATVDGVSTRTVVANHALGAVAVPAGTHTIELVYRTPGIRLGVAVSAATVVLVVLVLAVPPVVRRVRRRHGSSHGTHAAA